MRGVLQDVVAVEEHEVMARDEVGFLQEERRLDRPRAEAQMRNRDGAGLLEIVDEVTLRIERRMVGDDLYRVLVGPNRPVRAEPDEDGAELVRRLQTETLVESERQTADIVSDADREASLRLLRPQFVVDRLDHRRREFFRGQAIASADRQRLDCAARSAARALFGQGGDHVLKERFADRARFAAAVQRRDPARGTRQRLEEGVDGERAEQVHLEHARLAAVAIEPLGSDLRRLGPRSDDDNHLFGVGSADVVEQPVLSTGDRGEAVHLALNDRRQGVVIGIAGLDPLKVGVGILGGAAQNRMVGAERATTHRGDFAFIDHAAQVVIGERRDLRHFVRGAKTVEEMHERHARA